MILLSLFNTLNQGGKKVGKIFVYTMTLDEVKTVYRWRRECKRKRHNCDDCRFKEFCLPAFESFQDLREHLEGLDNCDG